MKILCVTEGSGLIGSEVVARWHVCDVDNNMRAGFFRTAGDTCWNQQRLSEAYNALSRGLMVSAQRSLRASADCMT
jgi:hypothetical protein